ncbi:MAG: hypothetical protein ACOYOV_00255 [Bacteroidales bacterium]
MDFNSTYDTDAPELILRFRELLKQKFGAESNLAEARNKVSRISLLGNSDNEIIVYSKESIPADNVAQIQIRSVLTLSQFYLSVDDIQQLLTDAELFAELLNKLASKSSRVYATKEQVFETSGLILQFLK